MLNRELSYKNNAISNRIKKFGLAIKSSPPLLTRPNQIIFLCGASRSDGSGASTRRECIKKFIENLSIDYRVIYAEGVLTELSKLGHKKNVLDLEREISKIADKIIIVMESESAFCELGAFASHQNFRSKLIIINDSKFKNVTSFINVGPIAAVEEFKSPIIWYPMSQSGVNSPDGIGATFHVLAEEINRNRSTNSVPVTEDLTNLEYGKISLYFVHDLVLFTEPISHKELVEVFKTAFGVKNYDNLRHMLGILRASGLISSFFVANQWVYRTGTNKPFLKYNVNVNSLMASFRSFHLLNNPERFRIAK